MSSDALGEGFSGLLAAVAPMAEVRRIRAGGDPTLVWSILDDSGFLDALLPQGDGALELADVGPLIELAGRHLTPLPVGQTMVARALLRALGQGPVSGPITLATVRDGRSRNVAFAAVAQYFLVDLGGESRLIHRDQVTVVPPNSRDSINADIRYEPSPGDGPKLSLLAPLRPVSAAVNAAILAGVADRLLELSIDYANSRRQFGRPIGKQQAVQQLLALMAEKVVSMRIASRLALVGGIHGDASLCAVGKAVTSACAVDVADIAHAVHGAIGISDEHDLHLFTQTLFDTRMAEGSESYWYGELGRRRLDDGARSSVEFVRNLTQLGTGQGGSRP